MTALKGVFARARATYKTLKKSCEGRVVRWQWATFAIHEAEPYYHERHKIARGRKLKVKPAKVTSGMHQYGFDADGRVVIVRDYTEFKGRFYEEFFTYGDRVVEGTLFDGSSEKRVINVTCKTFDGDGKIIQYEAVATGGESTEIYEYARDRLKVIRKSGISYLPRSVYRFDDELEYDAIGRLSVIRRVDLSPKASRPHILYQRPQKGQSLNELAEVIREKLVRRTPQALRAKRLKGPAYCVILLYTNEDSIVLPPTLAIGLEEERRDWIEELGRGTKDMIWNYPEFKHTDVTPPWKDAELLAACELFNQQVAVGGKSNRARKLLNEIARELASADWSQTFDVTDDFVVFALDYEYEDFRANLKASVSPQRLALLKDRGWL
jgi:hypothetical protein